jgi:hypothetical protein
MRHLDTFSHLAVCLLRECLLLCVSPSSLHTCKDIVIHIAKCGLGENPTQCMIEGIANGLALEILFQHKHMALENV